MVDLPQPVGPTIATRSARSYIKAEILYKLAVGNIRETNVLKGERSCTGINALLMQNRPKLPPRQARQKLAVQRQLRSEVPRKRPRSH